MSNRESGVEDYLGFLQSLWTKHPSQFLFGGQAVNFWAEYFDRQSHLGELGSFRPFTSKDCDIWVSAPVWKEIKHQEGDRLVLPLSRDRIRRVDPQELRHLRQLFDDDRQDAHIPHC